MKGGGAIMNKETRWDSMSKGFKELNIQVHDKLLKLFKQHKGNRFTTKEIKELFKATYGEPSDSFKDICWVLPSDHSVNMVNKGACWCAETNDAIFKQIRRGLYEVC
jgi:hypothetical protein